MSENVDPGSSPALLVFDLDGVLARWDTMATLVIDRLKSRPWLVPVVLPPAVGADVVPPRSRWRPRLHRSAVRAALAGLSTEQYGLLARRIGTQMATDPRCVVDPSVARARTAHEQGRLVVATASEERLARAYLEGVGLIDVPLFASRIDVSLGGPSLVSHNVGESKHASLRRSGVALEQAHFFTDSASDLPVAESAARVTLVNPSGRSERIMRRALRECHVVRW